MHHHRHSFLHPFKQETQSALERSLTSVQRVLIAVNDHPAVAAAGWDVLRSGLSLGVWATIRNLDVPAILASTGLSLRHSAVTVNKEPSVKKGSIYENQDTAPRRSGRSRENIGDNDDTYQPPDPVTHVGEEAEDEDWDVGALAWGLISAVGLGAGSAGVFGAEVTAG